MIFPNNKPPIVLKIKAKRPNAIIFKVAGLRKVSAAAVAPTVVPRKMVTTLISPFS